MLNKIQQSLPYGAVRAWRIWKRRTLVSRFQSKALDRAHDAIATRLRDRDVKALWREVRPVFHLDQSSGAKWADWKLWLPLRDWATARQTLRLGVYA